MSYQWGPGGPAFEFEGVFRTENRMLVLRALVMALLAVAALVLAMADLRFPPWMSPRLTMLPRGERTPHLLMGLFLLVLAVLDLLRASRQRRQSLLPGQPASLVQPMPPSDGASPGAAAIVRLLSGEAAEVPAPSGHWRRLLRRLAPAIGAAPRALQDWLEWRLAHLALIGGLLLVLTLGAWLLRQAASAAVVAAMCIVIMGIQALRGSWVAATAPRPRQIGALLALSLALGLPLGWAARWLPLGAAELMAAPGLPLGAAWLLGALLLIEALALRAGLAAADHPLAGGLRLAPVQVEIAADAGSLRQEIEREMQIGRAHV